jgi:hypothetical protein
MSRLRSIQSKARELARSGEFHGWLPIKFELRFEDGYADAREWLNRPATREELDRVCQKARVRRLQPKRAKASRSIMSQDHALK